ncbi:MAG: proline--tRNA ligase [Candidatus Zixiibacteriota bacterium]|nr:MAG: proline--tRNA ligase [candidate division Zixibacteria bacterium]
MSKSKAPKTAISPRREEDYPEWYQQVIKEADMAEMSHVRGCMVIKPWGYGIWENFKAALDGKIKETGHENAYFPLFIPLSFLEKEASHVEGFAKECAVVTHHRLVQKDGALIPTGELEEPLVVRPTSETIIGRSFARWVQSYRDLPLLINQWANVVRWEMRPRIFLRTTEFLWQEGHTAHASRKEAMEETLTMLEAYRWFAEEILAIPVIIGEKTPAERFPGAENTYCIEAMMQDRKALQAGTSHYLGQNFAKAFDIKFLNKDGILENAYTTSWGVSSRMVGAMVMVHGDDDGLRLPPRVAPKQVMIIPVLNKPEHEAEVLAYADAVAGDIGRQMYGGLPVRVQVDRRDLRSVEKKWQWVKKGVPIRMELGYRDFSSNSVFMQRRDRTNDRLTPGRDEVAGMIPEILANMQQNYFDQSKAYMEAHTHYDIDTFKEFTRFFTPKDPEKPEIHGGFAACKWCEDARCEEQAAEMNVTIRCIPNRQSGTEGRCVICGQPARIDVIFAKAY